ncbi:hypothetical protein BC332_16563 [Capsicum chinense]|nr:hypothetical protein BC332_16563 [Capsicum chinense]
MGYTVLGICGPTRTGSTSFGSWVKVVLPMSSLFSDTSNPGVAKKLKHPPHISGLKDQSWKHEAYLLFPVHLDGTLLDNAKTMNAKKEFFSKFHFRCASNISSALCILLKPRKGQPPLATLMDFGSARPARKANLFSFRGPSIAGFSCLLFLNLAYGVSPFEYALGESGGSGEVLHQFVTWMLWPQPTVGPCIDDILIHVDKLVTGGDALG